MQKCVYISTYDMLFKTRPYGWWSCSFLLFLTGALSISLGELGKENCTNTIDITKVCNKDDDGGDNVGAMFQEEIARFPNVGMNLEKKKLRGEFLLPLDTKLKEIFGIALPSKDVGNALHLLEFYKVFGKVWFYVNNLSWCFVWLIAIHCCI